MKNEKFNKTLSEVTNFQIIKWVRSYNGNNDFINSCRRKMINNYPLNTNQFNGLKKCYAYLLVNKNSTEKSIEKGIEELLKTKEEN